jgi:aminoglycoside N3'-acetyltransferase
MERELSSARIEAALEAVGVAPGRLVYVSADLRRPGMVAGARDAGAFAGAYLEAFRRLLGPKGTLVVPTFTPQVLRTSTDFILESTPALTGLFAEQVRQTPGALRSWHPLSSFCALGAEQEAICAGTGTDNFGFGSPFERMRARDVLVVAIGLESGWAMGTPHHLESMMAVPYTYHKLLDCRTFVQGAPLPLRFSATVCYQHIRIRHDFHAWTKLAREAGALRSAPLGRAEVHSGEYRACFDLAAREMLTDPYFLLAERPEIPHGPVPYDPPRTVEDPNHNWISESLCRQVVVGGH